MSFFFSLYKPAEVEVPWYIRAFLKQCVQELMFDFGNAKGDGTEYIDCGYLGELVNDGYFDEWKEDIVCPQCHGEVGIGNRNMGCRLCGDRPMMDLVKDWFDANDGKIIHASW